VSESIPEAVLADLYDYPRKRTGVAYALWLLVGLFGVHRFYLNRTWTGLLMLLTGGGALVWWFVDAFLIRSMIRTHNGLQDARKARGLPPVALDFLPLSDGSELTRLPAWYIPESSRSPKRIGRIAADVVVLLFAGASLGFLTRATGNIEAVVAVGALLLLLNFGRQLAPLHDVPLVGQLVRWSYRLRLFYHHVGPGSAWSRLIRPMVGFMFAPFRKKSRAEVGLYLRLGGAFAVLFLLEDVATEVVAPIVARSDLIGLTGVWIFRDLALTLLFIYAFTTPIGATLMLYLLTRTSHLALGSLSLLTILAIAAGFLSVLGGI